MTKGNFYLSSIYQHKNRFKEIRQIITDIKKGNSTSTQWFEAVERIQKEKLYIVKLYIQ